MDVIRATSFWFLGLLLVGGWGAHAQSPLPSAAEKEVQRLERRPAELRIQYDRARSAWESGASFLEAKVRLDRVLHEMPDDAEARKLRALVLLEMDRPKEALVDARRAAELAPDDAEARLIQVRALCMQGEKKAARRVLHEAAEQVVSEAPLYVRLSWNAEQVNLLGKAEEFARKALTHNANLASAYYQLARVLVRRKQADRAAGVLARGFEASVLTPGVVLRDTRLRRLARHRSLQEYLPQ